MKSSQAKIDPKADNCDDSNNESLVSSDNTNSETVSVGSPLLDTQMVDAMPKRDRLCLNNNDDTSDGTKIFFGHSSTLQSLNHSGL